MDTLRIVKIDDNGAILDAKTDSSLMCHFSEMRSCRKTCAIFRVDELEKGHSWIKQSPNGEKYALSCGMNLIGLLENE